jgi:hypothetical protein
MQGVGQNVFAMLRPADRLHAVSAISLIINYPYFLCPFKKITWILADPVFVFISFLLREKYIMGLNEQH